MQAAYLGGCLFHCPTSFMFGCLNLICVVWDRFGDVCSWSFMGCCLCQFADLYIRLGFP